MAKERVDLVAMTRAFITDPEFIHKTLEGKTSEIRRCVRCNTCIDNAMYGSLMCLANPEAGREAEFLLKPANKPKKVLIIGGGLAGLETARIAASRGHQVSIHEESDELGGQWLLAAAPPHKMGFKSLTNYLTGQIQNLGVNVELGRKVALADVS